MIALHAAIHDGSVALLLNTFLRDSRIDPIWKAPHLRTNLAPFDFTTGMLLHNIFEGLIKISIIEENVGIVEPPIEMPLD